MNFLSAVVRIMCAEGILAGDTDEPTTFDDLQHKGSMRMARLAVQDELTAVAADVELPYERSTSGSITTVSGTRTYALASDFVRFSGTPLLYIAAENQQIFEYRGGEDALRLGLFAYKTQQGTPFAFYFEGTTTKKLALVYVPNEVKTYTYDYEKDVSVTNSTDTLPFHNEIEAQAFCRLAARRFKLLFQGMDPALLASDPEHTKAKAALMALIVGKRPANSYAPIYR